MKKSLGILYESLVQIKLKNWNSIMSQTPDYILLMFLLIVLSMAAIIDIRTQKIPNLLTYSALIVVLSYHSITNGWSGFFFSTLGIIVGLGLLMVPYFLEGMGAGDAKLLAVVGGTIGAVGVFYAFLCIAIIGGIYSIIIILSNRSQFKGFLNNQLMSIINILLFRKYIPNQIKNHSRPKLCYGMAIAIGTGIYIALKMSTKII